MKDLLSLSFQLKKYAVASKWSADEAIGRCEPLLAALAALEGVSEGAIIAQLLAKHLQHVDSSKCDAITGVVAKCIPEADEEMGESVKLKSGALDKVGDACLKLALGYLGFKDRCNAVERSCHRLFALSRAQPLQCHEFAEVWNQHMDSLKVARRFRTNLFDCDSECRFVRHLTSNPQLADSIMEHIRKDITEMCISDNAFERISTLTFPKLNAVRCLKFATVPLLSLVLSNNPTVSELICSMEIEERIETSLTVFRQLFEATAGCKNLRKLTLGLYYSPAIGDAIDKLSSHIVDVTLSGDCSFLPCVLHDDLQQLTLSGYFSQVPDVTNVTKPATLRSLDLLQLYTKNFAEMRFFARCQLDTLKLHAKVRELAQVYEHYSPTHLLVRLSGNGSDDDANTDKCLQSLVPILTGESAQTLTFCFQYSTVRATDIRPLFTLLSQISAAVKTRIKVETTEMFWDAATRHLSPLLLRALGSAVIRVNQ